MVVKRTSQNMFALLVALFASLATTEPVAFCS